MQKKLQKLLLECENALEREGEKLSWLSLSSKIENVLITVHEYLHREKILNTAALRA